MRKNKTQTWKKFLAVTLLSFALSGTLISFAHADGFTSNAWNGIKNGVGDLFSGSSDQTSFTEFKGGLAAPSTDGYDPGLTQATDAKTYAMKVTNFILGFLGFVAILVVVYGGFLYVTAAGKEDKAETGKKAITYAIIGILVILGSYAIVNTVLQAPGGTDQLHGSGSQEVASSSDPKARFHAMSANIKTLAVNIITAYQFHFEAIADLNIVKNDLNSDRVWKSGDGNGNPLGLLQSQKPIFDDAVSKLNVLSSHVTSDFDAVYGIKAKIQNVADLITTTYNNAYQAAENYATKEGCNGNATATNPCTPDDEETVMGANFYDLLPWGYKAKNGTAGVTWDPLIKLQDSATGKSGILNAVINRTKQQLKDMYDQVHPVTTVADKAFYDLISQTDIDKNILQIQYSQFNDWAGGLKDFETKTLDPSMTTLPDPPTDLQNLIGLFNNLYQILKNIDFVDAHLTASLTEGSAPVAVNFSAVGSLDPTGVTITDQQVCWDLNGDGVYGDADQCKSAGSTIGPIAGGSGSAADCQEKSAQTATCIYSNPGTYRVRVKIYSSDPTKIAAGIAEVVIKVDPPQNKINLDMSYNANGSPQQLEIMKYDDTTSAIVADLNQVIVPLSAANAGDGITFDAALSKTKDNQKFVDVAAKGATIKWDFGDQVVDGINNQPFTADPKHITLSHKYTKTGAYTVTVELTDQNKISDRKIFSMVVADLAPAVQVTPTAANVGQEVTFDGSNSVSDNGPITDYSWSIKRGDTEVFAKDGKDLSVVKQTFDTPGQYTVSLTLTNSSGKQSTAAVIPFTVSSAAPVAQFASDFPIKTQPGLLVLDGTSSYDPDGTKDEKLTYTWQVDGQDIGSLPTSTGALMPDLMKNADPNSTGAVQVIKFASTGSHKVQLTVSDPHGFCSTDDATCAQPSQPVSKDVQVDSVLDIGWQANDVPSQILKLDPKTNQLSATLTLTVLSDNGSSYAVDFGDGSNKQDVISKSVTINHTYTQAGAYNVKATVYDSSNNSNSITRKVYIGSNTTPAAVIAVKVNGNPVLDTSNPIEVSRKDVISFDASNSKNTDGSSKNLTYSWDFGDGKFSTTAQASHQYADLGQYQVKLTATNSSDASQTSQDTLTFTVVGLQPIIRGLTAVPVGSGLTTPIQVNVKAIGADSPDSQIVKYRWWYYDPNNDSDQLGTQITTTPSATLTINTKGREGEQHTYKFGVEITDAENQVLSSNDPNRGLSPNLVPIINVVNGVNTIPTVKVHADRTNILVGDSVNFTADTSDNSNNQNLKYYWDFTGNGFGGLQDQGPNVSYTFNTPSKNGIKVRVKIANDTDASSTSDPVTIFVDGKAQPPVAAFTSQVMTGSKTVSFINNSHADATSGASITNYSWDFDLNRDSDGDGIKDNDNDSNAQTPTYEYPDYGVYRVKLTVTDSDGNSSSVTNFVNVSAPSPTPGHPSAQNTYAADVFRTDMGAETLALLVTISLFAILLINVRLNKKTNARKHSTKR